MLIGSISTVIVFTLLLATAGTMGRAIREREREVAVLKALGFDGWRIGGMMLAESCGMALAGGLLGCLGAWLVLSTIDVQKLSHGLFVRFELTPQILADGLLVSLALGIASCVLAAWRSVRKGVAEGLRTAD